MTVWLVNAFWDLPQEGRRAQRYWLMAKAFALGGHKVVYFTSDFSHMTKKPRVIIDAEVTNCEFTAEDIRVILLPTTPYKKNISLSRIASHYNLSKTFLKFAEKESEKPDLIVATTPPLSLCNAARKHAKRSDAKFICDIQDLWPETFERIMPRFLLLPLRSLAKRIYQSADGIVATGNSYLEHAKNLYGAKCSSIFLPQLISSRLDKRELRNLKEEKNIRLVYCGNMSKSYDLETVIKGVLEMPEVTLDLAGDGPDRPALESIANGCDRIHVHQYLGEAKLLKLLDNSDVGVIPMFPDSCVAIPGKMADYSKSRLRIVECLGGDCEKMAKRFNVGVNYKASDIESFKNAVSSVKELKADFDGFQNAFDASKVSKEFVSFAEKIVDSI